MPTDLKIIIVVAIIAGLLGGASASRDKSSPGEIWRTIAWFAILGFVAATIIDVVIYLIGTSEPHTGDLEDPDFCTVNVC